MATIQVIEDGPRNLIINVVGNGVEANTVIADPTTSGNPWRTLALIRALYSISEVNSFSLIWDGTTPATALYLWGGSAFLPFGKMAGYSETGGIPDNAIAPTGKVLLNGGTASSGYSLFLEFVKHT
jgi:hypothetical protein